MRHKAVLRRIFGVAHIIHINTIALYRRCASCEENPNSNIIYKNKLGIM
jgi:hypothetical protein